VDQSRRHFLKHTLAATAACGLARIDAAPAAPLTEALIDTHVYLGHWPHQTLSSEIPATLIDQLRKSGVAQAWIGNFNGLFHKDAARVNERLATTCAKLGDGLLIPFGTVNPTLPDWEDDIRRCHESFHMPGIRLHPNYHGYKLDDPRFSRLLELASARGLIVQLVAWLEDERHFLLSPATMQVDLAPLAGKAAAFPSLKLLVAGGNWANDGETMRGLLRQKQTYFDFSRARGSSDIRRLVELATADRVVFGSGMPLHDTVVNAAKLRELNLNDSDSKAVTTKNAGGLLAKSQH
jgi:predicted TIM-barrel fold metal-dependent hydrolase